MKIFLVCWEGVIQFGILTSSLTQTSNMVADAELEARSNLGDDNWDYSDVRVNLTAKGLLCLDAFDASDL